jgi:hypothetical protein
VPGVPSAVQPPRLDEEIGWAEDPDTLDLREVDEMSVQADDPVRAPPDRRRQDHVVRRVAGHESPGLTGQDSIRHGDDCRYEGLSIHLGGVANAMRRRSAPLDGP